MVWFQKLHRPEICIHLPEHVPNRDDVYGYNMKELRTGGWCSPPQGLCALMDEDVLSKVKVIDLSADFRIKDVSVCEKWYVDPCIPAVYR